MLFLVCILTCSENSRCGAKTSPALTIRHRLQEVASKMHLAGLLAGSLDPAAHLLGQAILTAGIAASSCFQIPFTLRRALLSTA